MSDLTHLLQAIDQGDQNAATELLPLVYEELRALARCKMANEAPGQTLQPTALVHEAWLRLAGSHQSWRNRRHFFGAAAEAMRRILVDNARRKHSRKRGAGLERTELGDSEIVSGETDEKLLLVDEALEVLTTEDPVRAEVVKLRFFVGLENEETAALLGISSKTVQRYWTLAKVQLFREIEKRR